MYADAHCWYIAYEEHPPGTPSLVLVLLLPGWFWTFLKQVVVYYIWALYFRTPIIDPVCLWSSGGHDGFFLIRIFKKNFFDLYKRKNAGKHGKSRESGKRKNPCPHSKKAEIVSLRDMSESYNSLCFAHLGLGFWVFSLSQVKNRGKLTSVAWICWCLVH